MIDNKMDVKCEDIEPNEKDIEMKDVESQKKYYAIDLFCGAGGCSEGLIQAGFHILYSSDISDMVEETYRTRHIQLGLNQGVNTYFKRADIKDLKWRDMYNSISSLAMFKTEKCPDDIDLVIGGPSCQGFSMAGRRDKSDPRNMLFGEYVRVVSEIKPKYIILENVEGFMTMQFLGYKGITGHVYPDGSVTPDILRNELKLIGYETLEPRVLNAADYGVPQQRKRVIFIGYRQGLARPEYPTPTTSGNNRLTLLDAIGDLILDEKTRMGVCKKKTQFQVDSTNGRTPSLLTGRPIKAHELHNTELPKQTDIVRERFGLFKEGESGANLAKRIKAEGIDISDKPALIGLCKEKLGYPIETEDSVIIDLFRKSDVQEEAIDALLTKKSMRKRWASNEPSGTVVSVADDAISPWEDRTFSVREMARCQSFDDSFVFCGKRTTGGLRRRVEIPQYTQVGNAVPPLLAKAVASEIIKVLIK